MTTIDIHNLHTKYIYCNTVGVKTPTALKYILDIVIYLLCCFDAFFIKIYLKKAKALCGCWMHKSWPAKNQTLFDKKKYSTH